MRTYSEFERLRALRYFFASPNATTAEIEALTIPGFGTREPEHLGANLGGFSAIRTCNAPWRCGVLAPKHRGDWQFWQAAIVGFYATGALDEEVE